MKQHKFLSIIITNTLSWSVQTTYAVTKGTAYILQLKRPSSVTNGITLSLMRQLYLAVVIPKMLYIWFRPTYIDDQDTSQLGSKGVACKPEKVQHIALLSITGTMHSTAMDTLEIHCNIWPIAHRIQIFCQQAMAQLMAHLNSHPLHPLATHAAVCFIKHHHSSLHLLCHSFNLSSQNVEMITPHQPSPHVTLRSCPIKRLPSPYMPTIPNPTAPPFTVMARLAQQP